MTDNATKTAVKTEIQLDFYGDPICPWCYIGHKRLQRALAMRPDFDVVVRWRPFQLNPDMPRDGMDRQTYLDLKFGGAVRAKAVYAQITKAGAEEGIDFRFDLIEKTPNTVDAHCLLLLADRQGKQDGVAKALYDAYFLQGRDIGDRGVLAEIGEACGLEAPLAYLESGAGQEEVLFADQYARSLGLGGVPCFIVNRQHVLPGAQDPDTLVQLLDIGYQQRLVSN